MTLAEERIEFTRLIAVLVTWASDHGILVAFDDVKSCPVCKRHRDKSYHYKGLACDVLIYRYRQIPGHGTQVLDYITDGQDDSYQRLGRKWLSMNDYCSWGGAFRDKNGELTGDAGHFSWGE